MGTVPDLRTEHSGVVESGLSPFCTGFTLIELLIVLFILSITLSFVVPRIMGKEEAELRSSARRLLYTARQLSDDALFRKERKTLSIDIDKGIYREVGGARGSRLPEGVSIKEVVAGKGGVVKGEASITFFPSGFRDEAEIKLAGRGKGKEYTVVIPALGERFEVREE